MRSELQDQRGEKKVSRCSQISFYFFFSFRAMVFRGIGVSYALGMSRFSDGATELGLFGSTTRGEKRDRPCRKRNIKKRERILREVPWVSERAVYYYHYYYYYFGLGYLLFGGGVVYMSGEKAVHGFLTMSFNFNAVWYQVSRVLVKLASEKYQWSGCTILSVVAFHEPRARHL